jgi:hypothetical protein
MIKKGITPYQFASTINLRYEDLCELTPIALDYPTPIELREHLRLASGYDGGSIGATGGRTVRPKLQLI